MTTPRFRVEHHAVITPSGKLFHRCRTKDEAKRECELLNDELSDIIDPAAQPQRMVKINPDWPNKKSASSKCKPLAGGYKGCSTHNHFGSDCPKSAASSEPQEWTPETVDALLHNGLSPCKDVADAHSSELKAERRSSSVIMARAVKKIDRLQQELAAERERVRLCGNCLKASRSLRASDKEKIQELIRALAAERENFEIEVERGNQYCKQLLAAEAAIAAHNNDPEMVDKCGKFTVELSDLEQHDKETRKPLLEALKHFTKSKIARDALASVKEPRYTGEATGEGE